VNIDIYRERAFLVAHLASIYPSFLGHVDPDEPEWPVVFVETPSGQMSWHISPSDVDLFSHVARDDAYVWDGHSTDEKYDRMRVLTASNRG
jgi:hypothetical protein